MNSTNTLSRRRFNAALPPLLGSVLAGIKARAAGDSKPPMRFVFVLKSNGLWADNVQPVGMEKLLPFKVAYDKDGRLEGGNHGNIRKENTPAADQALAKGWQLNPMMESLAPFQDKISILQGINSGFNVYHLGNYQTLGAFQGKTRNSRETLGPTIDHVLAQATGGLGLAAICKGDPIVGRTRLLDAEMRLAELGDMAELVHTRIALAWLALGDGRLHRAVELGREVERLARETQQLDQGKPAFAT